MSSTMKGYFKAGIELSVDRHSEASRRHYNGCGHVFEGKPKFCPECGRRRSRMKVTTRPFWDAFPEAFKACFTRHDMEWQEMPRFFEAPKGFQVKLYHLDQTCDDPMELHLGVNITRCTGYGGTGKERTFAETVQLLEEVAQELRTLGFDDSDLKVYSAVDYV